MRGRGCTRSLEMESCPSDGFSKRLSTDRLIIKSHLCPFFPQMFMSEAGKISQKIKVWFSDYFNLSDFLAILTFFIGFGLRLGGGEAFIPGRTVYCLNIIFWYVRLLDILAVNQQAGPYVMMIAKMVS